MSRLEYENNLLGGLVVASHEIGHHELFRCTARLANGFEGTVVVRKGHCIDFDLLPNQTFESEPRYK